MRIGLITGEYPPMKGGIATQTHILAQKLAATDATVHVLTHPDGTSAATNVTLHPVIRHWGAAALRQTRHWASLHQLDVVNLHYQTAAFGMSPFIHWLPLALRGVVPLITTFHDLRFPYLFPKAGPLRPWVVNHLARGSAGVVATNQEDAARLQQHNANHRLIPIGSNIISQQPTDANAHIAAGASKDEMVLAFFGFVNHSKGLDVLLHSLAALQEKEVPARLLMIGDRTGSSDPTNAAYSEQIDRIITEYELHEQVQWTGFQPEAAVRALLHSADVVVMPFRDGASYRRSSLTSAIEQACCIVTTNPAVPVPAFRDGENMRLVPPGDAPALTNALLDLYNRPSHRQALRRGASALRATFGWEGIVAQYHAFYREMTEAAFEE